jgi:16S rRNA processing protein RimM
MTGKNTSEPQDNQTTGSPERGEPVFVALGFLRRTHGIRGELVMDILTDFPERLRPNRPVFLGEDHTPHRLGTVRQANKVMLVSIKGFTNPEEAARFRNTYVYVRSDNLPQLPQDAYYYHELMGIAVMDEKGQALGVLESILETGANDVYVVRQPDGAELLVPAIAEVVMTVDLERFEMIVRLQQWD